MALATDITKAAVQGANERLDQTRKQAYAAELWSKAQSQESKLKSDGCTHKSVSDSLTWFTRIEKTEYVLKAGGVQPTPFKEGEYDRRGLITQSYHNALSVDRDDLADSATNPLMDRRSQNMKALGRLCDQVILGSMMDESLVNKAPLQEDFSTTATQTDGKRHYPVGGLTTMKKDVCFVPSDKKTGNDAAKVIQFSGVDALEDIKLVFRKRNIDEMLVATYTPELQGFLRKDRDFKNAENVYSSTELGKVSGEGKGFVYKNIRFIHINEDALPALSTDGVAQAVTGTGASATYTLRCRAMDNTDVAGKVAATLPAKASTAGAVVRDVTEVQKQDMAYFWVEKSLYFAERGDISIDEETTNPNWSHAKQLYSRVNIGAMCVDENFILLTPVKGRRVA